MKKDKTTPSREYETALLLKSTELTMSEFSESAGAPIFFFAHLELFRLYLQ